MLTNLSKYAIRSVLYLAIHTNEDKKIGSKEVANIIKVPAPFLAKILQSLVKKGLISSSKGPNGGFYLTPKNNQNSMLDIVACTEGIDLFKACFLGLERCGDDNPCAIHHMVAPFKKAMIDGMGDKTIAQFAKETKDGKSFLFLEN
ncbi:MAG: Rrf2 family transcriptional regulator [Flavobacteriaceae bacterium]